MRGMQFMKKYAVRASATLAALALPFLASAHEVYVLSQAEIAKDVSAPAFSSLDVMMSDLHQFAFWAIVAVTTVVGIFALSISRRLETRLDPFLARLKPYAGMVSRVTVGIAFIAAAFYGAAYGPELPLGANWGAYTPLVQTVMSLIGLCLIFGIGVRVASFVGLLLFVANCYFHGWYMLTYTNYLGEIILLILVGTHGTALTMKGMIGRIATALAPYSFLILRVCFGISLIYSSIYAKFIHNNLALDVANSTGLIASIMPHAHTIAEYLGFEPHFLVLGAGILEVVIGMFFILGLEIRFTALFIEFWLGLSLWYFGEVVWPHLILVGIPIAFLCYGYDNYSLEGWVMKRARMKEIPLEPVL